MRICDLVAGVVGWVNGVYLVLRSELEAEIVTHLGLVPFIRGRIPHWQDSGLFLTYYRLLHIVHFGIAIFFQVLLFDYLEKRAIFCEFPLTLLKHDFLLFLHTVAWAQSGLVKPSLFLLRQVNYIRRVLFKP